MEYMWKEILEQPEGLRVCAEANRGAIGRIAAAWKEKGIRSIVIAARGSSDHAAIYGKYMLETLAGIPVSLSAASVFTVYGKTVDFSGSAVVGISQSGAGEDILAVMSAAKAQGVPTACITNDAGSPLAGLCGHCLLCSVGVEKSVAATKTFTSEMLLLGLLAIRLSGDAAAGQAYQRVPDEMSKALALSEPIREQAAKYTYADSVVLLARGYDYCIALEGALKLSETCYLRAKGYAGSDFYHGPFAILDNRLPVIVFAPSGPTEANMVKLIKKIWEVDENILIVSDKKDICSLSGESILVPESASPINAPFVNAVVAQQFAYFVSKFRFLNPDTPHLLHKVTITR